MDKQLQDRVEQAVFDNLLRMVRAITAVGVEPVSAVSLVRERLDLVEEMARKEHRDQGVDVVVRADGDERTQAEAWMEATHPEASARHISDIRRERRGQPAAPWPRGDNQADYAGGTYPIAQVQEAGTDHPGGEGGGSSPQAPDASDPAGR